MDAKRTHVAVPTYDLDALKVIVKEKDRRAFTGSSMAGIAELGMTVADAIDCIDCLSQDDFYKTMPSQQDPGHFQDVYRGKYWNEVVYIKFTGYSVGPVVISFKEK
jgi:hypothetical protein